MDSYIFFLVGVSEKPSQLIMITATATETTRTTTKTTRTTTAEKRLRAMFYLIQQQKDSFCAEFE